MDFSSPIMATIEEYISGIQGTPPGRIELHIFGSILRPSSAPPSDIDIAIIYESQDFDFVHDICGRLRGLDTTPPIDVIALNIEEEEETDFLRLVQARKLWSSQTDR
ncbi:nucleotidyltransferase domain-containing protein [Kitasatospora sp. NPDC058444]|uniref:nucleotidyltransferase domain-containing protein n=1 Tax=Kitasatospora sp. NPDC058444 TaxID=3346504 RepID=UPI003661DF88